LAEIQEKGEIVVAMEGTWAPWTYMDEDGDLVGYDVEVAEAIAEKLGVEASFVTGEWDGLLAGLDAGTYSTLEDIETDLTGQSLLAPLSVLPSLDAGDGAPDLLPTPAAPAE